MAFSHQSSNVNLGGWAEVGEFAATHGKKLISFSVDYCKKNPDKCMEHGTKIFEGAAGTPIQVPAFFGGLNKNNAGEYSVSGTSALNVRAAPAITAGNIIAVLARGQMVVSQGTGAMYPKWHFASIPGQNVKGWVSQGSSGQYLKRFVPPAQRAYLPPGEKLMTQEEFWANYEQSDKSDDWKQGSEQGKKLGLGTLAAGAVAAYFLLK